MALSTPPPIPQRGDRATFGDRLDAFLRWLGGFVAEFNAAIAALSSWLAGGAYSIPYVWGPGINIGQQPSQSTTTLFAITNANAAGVSVLPQLQQFDSSTGTVKGTLRIVAQGDPARFIVFNITGRVDAGTYQVISGAVVQASGDNPLITNESVLLYFQRAGDKGDKGDKGDAGANGTPVLLAQSTISTTAANIDFLNVFTAAYDKYIIELSNYQANSTLTLLFQVAAAGAAVGTANYTALLAQSSSGVMNATSVFVGANPHLAGAGQPNLSFEVCNVNSTTAPKSVGVRGAFKDINGNLDGVNGTAFVDLAAALTGFRLSWNGAGAFSKATVRVYGIKNS